MPASAPAWIAADCSDAGLALWVMDGENRVLAAQRVAVDQGPLPLERLRAALGCALGAVPAPCPDAPAPLPVICSGRVASDLPLASALTATPCPALGAERLQALPNADARFALWLLPGFQQARPADLIDSDSACIAGLVAQRPEFDGILCLPGAVTRWVHISAREVVSFRSFLTGGLRRALAAHPLLHGAVSGSDWQEDGFAEAVADAMSRPQTLAAELMSISARHRLEDAASGQGSARLTGLLIGAELSAARPYWLGQPVLVLGSEAQTAPYRAALAAQGAFVESASDDGLTLSGLTLAGLTQAAQTLRAKG